MAKDLLADKNAKKNKIRSSDDLELLSLILDELPDVRRKVIEFLESNLGSKIDQLQQEIKDNQVLKGGGQG